MNLGDLMIGDWVCTESDPTPRQVDWIRTGEVGLLWNKTVTPPFVNPIPLTPDILLANGFTSEPQIGFVSSDGRIILDDRFPNYPRKWYAHIDNEDFQSIASCDLDYLHQLQHLLTICGIEKEWKL